MMLPIFVIISSLELFSAETKNEKELKEGVYMYDYDRHYIFVKDNRTCVLVPHYGGYTVRDLGTVLENADKGFLKGLKKEKDINPKDYEDPKILSCLNSQKKYVEGHQGEWDASPKTK